MNADQDSTRRLASEDDLSIVPGLGPVPTPRSEAAAPLDPALDPDRYDPSRDTAPAGRLDPALDPDRYDPSRDTAPVGRLDPALDPDRYDPAADVPPGQGQTLPDLLGEGAFEEQRDNYQWAIGLAGIVLFLALVSWFFSSVATP